MAINKDLSKVKYFISKKKRELLLKEWLKKELEQAGFSSIKVLPSSAGGISTRVIIRVLRPGLIIGKRGFKIKQLSEEIEKRFGYENVRLIIYEVEEPELDPEIMSWQIEKQILKGVSHRRVAYWALRTIKNAGAAGAEIVISGKLRTARASYEKYTIGNIIKSGDLFKKLVRVAKRAFLTKTGIIGIRVLIMPKSVDEYYKSQVGEVTVKGGQ